MVKTTLISIELLTIIFLIYNEVLIPNYFIHLISCRKNNSSTSKQH